MSRYELKATRECGDATYIYDVIADYPILFDEFWRNVVKIDGSREDWKEAMWKNPFSNWARHQEFGSDADFGPYYGNGYIGIDTCTARSGKVNVLVVEDEIEED